uniref:Uncharacterized protein n=1 Tax=Trichuris muris TaxID=70415 RepID=A0A5S6R1F9_TRIMR
MIFAPRLDTADDTSTLLTNAKCHRTLGSVNEMDAPQLPPSRPSPSSDSRPSAAERPKRALRQPVWFRDYIIDN